MTKEFFEKGKKIAKWADNNMTKDEALKELLEIVEHAIKVNDWKVDGACDPEMIINACEEALEQPAQEPVALLEALSDLEHQQWMKWAQSIMDSEPISDARKQRWATMMVDYKDLPDNIQEYDREWARKVMALYTHPAPTWQGLSDDERFIIVQNADWDNPNDIAELIEQALKEKNTC